MNELQQILVPSMLCFWLFKESNNFMFLLNIIIGGDLLVFNVEAYITN